MDSTPKKKGKGSKVKTTALEPTLKLMLLLCVTDDPRYTNSITSLNLKPFTCKGALPVGFRYDEIFCLALMDRGRFIIRHVPHTERSALMFRQFDKYL